MSIIGIGTDLVQRTRIQALWLRFGEKFLTRILSSEEQQIFESLKLVDQQVAFLAKRFAAKEAVAKALGTGFGDLLGFKDISVTNAPSGQPKVSLQGKAARFVTLRKIRDIQISISDEKEYALAFVVIQGI